MNLINKKTENKGFTLIETLVAITILSFAIVATFGSAQKGLQTSIQSKDQVTAFFLAQEAVEYIKNKRDENRITGANWMTNISESAGGPCGASNSCYVDTTSDTIAPCSGGCAVINQDRNSSSSTYGLYGYDAAWTPTEFTRIINMTSMSASEENLQIVILWSEGTTIRNFTVAESLFDWQP